MLVPKVVPSTECVTFFASLFEDGLAANPDAAINLCWSPEGSSALDSFCLTRDPQVAAAAVANNPNHELFLKTSLYSIAGMEKRKAAKSFTPGGQDEVSVVCAIGLDLDCSKDPKYLDQGRALTAVASMPVQPTFVVQSGESGSLHLWWRLQDPVVIDSPEKLAEVKRLFKAWRDRLAACVKRVRDDATLDTISAPDRVLRPVGSIRGEFCVKVIRRGFDSVDYQQLPQILSAELEGQQAAAVGEPVESGGSKIIERWLDVNGVTVADLLIEAGCRSTGDGQWQREDAGPGASTRSAVEHFDGTTGRNGITVHSQNWDRFPQKSDGSTRWYSDAAIFVICRHGGDWKAAAAACGSKGGEGLVPHHRPRIKNYKVKKTLNAQGKEEDTVYPLDTRELLSELMEPQHFYSSAGTLFCEDLGEIRAFRNQTQFFGWLLKYHDISWKQGDSYIPKAEIYETLKLAATKVESIEVAPHFPPIPNVFYLNSVEPGDVADLYEFIDHFSPETEFDRELMLAAAVTPFWGNSGGNRPLFAITSEFGQGAGKTTFIEGIARLCGWGRASMHQFRDSKEFEGVVKSILSQAPSKPNTPRLAVADNYRGSRLGGATMESLVTGELITGHKMYEGEVEIPNLLTWFVSGNELQMTEDLAQRSVRISLAAPEYSGAWKQKLMSWDIEKVVAGIAAWFQLPKTPLEKVTRFDVWCCEILSRLQDPGYLIDHILGCKDELSVQSAENEETMNVLANLLQSLQTDPEAERDDLGRLRISAAAIAATKNQVRDGTRPWSAQYAGQRLTRLAKELNGRLVRAPRTKSFRGFIWKG